MRILITGSRGFVGGGVGRFAARAGHEVLGVGRATQAAPAWPGAYAQADVISSDLAPLVRDFAPDAVIHAAGTASVGASFVSPLDDLRAALLSFANTLDAVRRSGRAPVVLFPSSAAVYGRPAELPAREDAPLNPISPYGFHKAACELLAREYAECFGARVTVCRLFSVFGEGQRRLLVWELYKQLAGPAREVWLEGTGAETRDYLHIDDAADALLRLIEREVAEAEPDAGRLRVVNVASGEETNVLELAERVRALVAPGKEVRCRALERPGDPQRWRADTTRLRALAPGWQPRPFAQRLAQCVAAWRAGVVEHG
ncbi:MAG TPA: NAD-dependent epimerase/dehydratase family protein [Pyrinomonadaceae bacterium]